MKKSYLEIYFNIENLNGDVLSTSDKNPFNEENIFIGEMEVEDNMFS